MEGLPYPSSYFYSSTNVITIKFEGIITENMVEGKSWIQEIASCRRNIKESDNSGAVVYKIYREQGVSPSSIDKVSNHW
ncbi:hypothetical protein ACHQM5_018533 [Ranunculus cassubicifolius]